MKFHSMIAGVAVLAVAMLPGCTGRVDGSTPMSAQGSSGATGAMAGTGTAGVSVSSGGATASMPGTLNLDGSAKYYRVIRITNAQWGRAVQDILGLAAPSGLEQQFQSAVTGTTDFSNNELVLDVNQESWGTFQSASETLAAQVTATDAARFISTFGRRAYRRPLTAAEQATYLALFNQGTSLVGTRSNFAKGASLVIRAMLQSPNFLYRIELDAKQASLSGYEMAAKLSLWLRGTTPSDTLLDSAAGPGKLDTADGAVTLATTMLEEA